MTGRGVDQILPHPSSPAIFEEYMHDAREYVDLAASKNGPIARPVGFEYVWGDGLPDLQRATVRIVNLETAVTTSDDAWPDKGINYRMHPENVPSLISAGLDVCVLANNHVLDWGRAGLVETLETLRASGLKTAGAGRDLAEAEELAVVDVPRRGRVLVVSVAETSSGVPVSWEARRDAPGVALLRSLGEDEADAIAERIERIRRRGDLVVASIHWGSNWGYEIPEAHVRFAHALVERGIDVVHGHSSHHARPLEFHAGKPILYGCGDLINDYEGISGYEAFRNELVSMYLLRFSSSGTVELHVKPFRVRRMRLERALPADLAWLEETLFETCRPYGTEIGTDGEGGLLARAP